MRLVATPSRRRKREPTNVPGGNMRTMMSLSLLLAISAASTFSVSTLAGDPAPQDADVPQSDIEVFPDFIVRRIQEDDFASTAAKLVDNGVSQGILSGAKRWDTSTPIKVCFFGGSRELRRRIVATAAAWELPNTTIKFDFGDRNDPRLCAGGFSHIRVGYSLPGYWSFVGQDSIVHAQQTEESLNLSHFDQGTVMEPEFRRVVLHEFGHALGLQHEHQNPAASCENEYNWPAIYARLGSPPNSWSHEMVDHNMRSRNYFRGDVVTAFDSSSIMLYSFPEEYYINGRQSRCFSKGNTLISQGDVEIIAKAYGAEAPPHDEDIAAIRAALPTLKDDEQEIIRQRLALFEADDATKARIVGVVRGQYVDVDLFACDSGAETKALYSQMAKVVAAQPYLGKLRMRTEQFPEGIPLNNGISVIADVDHPEVGDAERFVSALGDSFPDQVRLVANEGKASNWYVSMVACAK